MSDVVIGNPVINSPFEEPQRHFRFTEAGITNEIVHGRHRVLVHRHDLQRGEL